MLGSDDSLTIGFDYRATDNAGVGEDNGRDELSESEAATVTLTILGTNDQPVAYEAEYTALESELANTAIGGVNETFTASLPGADSGSVLMNILTRSGLMGEGMDEDLLDAATLTFHLAQVPVTTDVVEREPDDGIDVVDASQTAVIVNEDGTFSVTNPTFDNLATGETATVTFQYYIDDESGAIATVDNAHESVHSDPVEVTVTITGTNDKPVIQNVDFSANEPHDDTFYQDGEDNTQGDSEVLLSKAVGVLSATDDDTNNTHVFNVQNYTASQYYNHDGLGGPGPHGDHGNIRFDQVDFYQKGPHNGSDTVKVMIASDPVQVGHLDVTKITFFNNDGADSQINFEVEGDFDALAVGETATITFKYIANDKEGFGGGHGGGGHDNHDDSPAHEPDSDNESSHSEPKFVTITITGTNDQPMVDTVVEGVDDAIYESYDSTDERGVDDTKEDVTTLFESRLTATDDDDNDTHTFHLVEGSVMIDNMPSTTVMLGQTGDEALGLDNWGEAVDSHTRELVLDNGMVITTSSDAKALHQYDHEAGHIGEGIGDNDGSGINVGETITVAMAGGFATSATFGFDGLGGHFRPDSAQQAKATWVAYNNGVEVASGEVDSATNFLTIDAGVPFDTVEFSTDSSSGSNWELRYVEAEVIPLDVIIDENGEYDVEGNFNYLASGETATVTFEYYADDQRGFGTEGDANNEASISEPKTVSVTITGTNDKPVVQEASFNAIESHDDTFYTDGIDNTQGDSEILLSKLVGVLSATDDDVSNTHKFIVKDYTASQYYGHGNGGPGQNGDAGNIRFDSVYFFKDGPNGGSENVKVMIESDPVQVSHLDVTALTLFNNNAQDSQANFELEGDFNALGVGESATITFKYMANDKEDFGKHGDENNEASLSEPKLVTVTIAGTNDQPIIQNIETRDAMETELAEVSYGRDIDISVDEISEDAQEGSALSVVVDTAAGETVAFDWNFSSTDFANDTAVVIIDGQIVGSVDTSSANTSGTYSYTFSDAGEHTVTFAVVNDRFDDRNDASWSATLDVAVNGDSEGVIIATSAFGDVAGSEATGWHLAAGSDEDIEGLDAFIDLKEVTYENAHLSGSLEDISDVHDDDDNDDYSYIAFDDMIIDSDNYIEVSSGQELMTTPIRVSLDADGNYNVVSSSFDKLGEGESVTISFDVQVQDDSGVGTGTAMMKAHSLKSKLLLW